MTSPSPAFRAAKEADDGPVDLAVCRCCNGTGLSNGAEHDDALEMGLRLLNAVRVIAFQSGEHPDHIVDWLTKDSGLLHLFEAARAAGKEE